MLGSSFCLPQMLGRWRRSLTPRKDSSASLISLAIARARDSAADLAPVMACSPALENRLGGRDRAPSLADIADNGAYTGGLHPPDPCGQAPPHTWRPDRRRSSGAVLEAAGAKLWTMAHIPVAWAAPPQPMRPAPPGPPPELRGGGSEIRLCGQWRSYPSPGLRPPDDCARPPPGPEPRALPLAILQERRLAPNGRPGGPGRGAEASPGPMTISAQPCGPRALLTPSLRRYGGSAAGRAPSAPASATLS